MVIIYDSTGQRCFGRYRHFKDAKPTLERFRKANEIPGEPPKVLVESYTGTTLQRTYYATYSDGWRTPSVSAVTTPEHANHKKPLREPHISKREKQRRTDKMFHDGMPSFINTPYPLFR